MSTRDDTRRELSDLGKRASSVPRDRPSDSQQVREQPGNGWTGSHITVPPAVASNPARRPPPPVSTGSLSYPVRKASWPVAVFRAAFGEGTGWRGIWAVLAGGTLAAAMVGGALLGQALTSRFSPETASEPSANPNAAPPESENRNATPTPPAVAAAAPLDTPTFPSPTALPTAVEGSSIAAPGAMLRGPHPPPPHHPEWRQPPRVIVVAPPPSNVAPRVAPAAKPPASRPNPQDALEELIRKAASGN